MTNGDRLAELVRERDKLRANLDECKAERREAIAELVDDVPPDGATNTRRDRIHALRDGIEALDAEISRCAAAPGQVDSGIGLSEGGAQ